MGACKLKIKYKSVEVVVNSIPSFNEAARMEVFSRQNLIRRAHRLYIHCVLASIKFLGASAKDDEFGKRILI